MRKRGSNFLVTLLMMIMLMVSFSTTAFAAEGDVPVEKITIENNSYTSNRVEQPWIYISSEQCYAEGDIVWEENFKYMKPGDVAHGTVTLKTNYGCYFDVNTTKIHSKDDELSATLDIVSENEARMNVRFVTQKRLSNVEFRNYDWGDRYIKWKSVSGAKEYQLDFFRSCDDQYYQSFTTTKTEFDLNKIKKELSKEDKREELYCEIRAIGRKDYLEESELTRSTTLTLKFKTENYSEDSVKPCPSKPSVIGVCEWVQKPDGTWYYTDYVSKKNATGWQMINGHWYYLNPHEDGKMCTGWIFLDNVWYYLVPSGEMVYNGWHPVNNKWYYFYPNGAMAYNTWIGNCYVDSSGAWVH